MFKKRRSIMAEPATRRMTFDEFLSWDDGTDTRYELWGGDAVAMALAAKPSRALRQLGVNRSRGSAGGSGGGDAGGAIPGWGLDPLLA